MLFESYRFDIKSHQTVLNAIRVCPDLSGAEIARQVGLQSSTLVYILRSLRKRGFIQKSRGAPRKIAAGKPPTLWRLNPDRGYVIGIEVIPDELRTTVVDFSGRIVHQSITTPAPTVSGAELTHSLVGCINATLSGVHLQQDKLIGIGIALTGLVDRKRGRIRYSRKLHIQNYPLVSALSERMSFPVEIINDANAGVLGLKWHAQDVMQKHRHVVFLSLNEKTGTMGAGLVLNNRIFEGAYGTAGELTASVPSLQILFQKAQQRYGKSAIPGNAYPVSMDDIIQYESDCAVCQAVLRQYTRFLAAEIVRFILLINPGLIVIGGDLSKAEPLIAERLLQRVQHRISSNFPAGIALPPIQFATGGVHSVSLGATSLMFRRIFSQDG
ncbi:MAG: ROK family transcriptional regulator [candidate division KSB1 bacterium]|nr:ROK family transcriptional regulator [candidate division KSB1 bacterium]